MDATQQIMAELKGSLDAFMLPWPDITQHEANARQAARVQYRNGGGLDISVSGARGNERQQRSRELTKMVDMGLIERVDTGERTRRVDFTEYGLQYAQHLIENADVEVLFLSLDDMYDLETNTPAGMPYFGTRYIPIWMVAGVPAWNESIPDRLQGDKIRINNTFMDMGAASAHGWTDGVTDADGRVYYSLTDNGRAMVQQKAEMPERYEFDPIPKDVQREVSGAYNAAVTAMRQRLCELDTNEVSIGVPVGGWTREGVQWVEKNYWRWRNKAYKPECIICATELKSVQAKTCGSSSCRDKHTKRKKQRGKTQ